MAHWNIIVPMFHYLHATCPALHCSHETTPLSTNNCSIWSKTMGSGASKPSQEQLEGVHVVIIGDIMRQTSIRKVSNYILKVVDMPASSWPPTWRLPEWSSLWSSPRSISTTAWPLSGLLSPLTGWRGRRSLSERHLAPATCRAEWWGSTRPRGSSAWRTARTFPSLTVSSPWAVWDQTRLGNHHQRNFCFFWKATDTYNFYIANMSVYILCILVRVDVQINQSFHLWAGGGLQELQSGRGCRSRHSDSWRWPCRGGACW